MSRVIISHLDCGCVVTSGERGKRREWCPEHAAEVLRELERFTTNIDREVRRVLAIADGREAVRQ